MNDAGDWKSTQSFAPICAIGASDGADAALGALMATLPPDLGLAYVVLRSHSRPGPATAPSLDGAQMPVVDLLDAGSVEVDRIHIAPPDHHVVLDGDRVVARPTTGGSEDDAPIDRLFRMLADTRGDGLCVVLAGPGTDGARGARAIRGGAGVVIVQDPAEAELATMPRAAIATGAVDFVLPVREMGERIGRIARAKAAAEHDAAADGVLERILERIHADAGHDFSGYDRGTMEARLRRRMEVFGVLDPAAYEALLAERPDEPQALLRDLLNPMTAFFRDPAAFRTLAETVIPTVVEERDSGDGVRVWVPGCATGEEAYSLAMLFLEEADRRGVSFSLQIFATDVDRGALAAARYGRYPAAVEADVSTDRLGRFFVREGAYCRIGPRLREAVLFAEHDLLRDPPFTRMDLDSCRNVLRLFGPEMRARALAQMHYALRPDGHLFLGRGEEADPDLFVPLRPDASLHMARAQTVPRGAEVIALPAPRRRARPPKPEWAADVPGEVLDATMPPSVVVDEERRVLHLSDGAGRYLRPSAGPFSYELPSLARTELRAALQAALHRALAEGRTGVTAPKPVAMSGGRRWVGLHVRPLAGADPARALVLFLDGGVVEPAEEQEPAEMMDLREQLRVSQGRLELCQAERETVSEELQVAVEELDSTREEHLSTRSELALCGVERAALEQEMKALRGELGPARDAASSERAALRELAAAAGIGAMRLDAELRPVVVPDPAIGSGPARILGDLTRGPEWARIEAQAREVLRDGRAAERDVANGDGRRFTLHLRPHRGPGGEVEGVLLCLLPKAPAGET